MKILFRLFLLLLAPYGFSKNISEMSLDEKISRLFILPACPNLEKNLTNSFKYLIDAYHLDSALLKQCNEQSLREYRDEIQKDLFYFIDAENGLGNMMEDHFCFPKNMTLGAVQDMNLIEKLGYCMGVQLRTHQVYVNFAPVVDVNSNPENPIIRMRSFGDDPVEVTKRARALIRGMHRAHISVCAKHFPGHGDTAQDSHYALPVLNHTMEEMESIHLYPFKELSPDLDMIMSAHILFPKMDNKPATLSEYFMTEVIRKEMQFEGLVVTDALNMRGIAKYYDPPTAAVQALKAGTDFLLYGSHRSWLIKAIYREFPKVFRAVRRAYLTGELDLKDLDRKIAKIEAFKKKMRVKIKLKPLNSYLVVQSIYDAAITLVSDRNQKLPSDLEKYKEVFIEEMPNVDKLSKEHPEKNLIVYVSMKEITSSDWIHALEEEKNIIWVHLSSPYLLKNYEGVSTLLIGYESNDFSKKATRKIIFGQKKPEGSLPIQR